MLEALKEAVCRANLLLVQYGLVKFTWGNVSGIDREKGLVVIKPSGVAYERLNAEDMVVVDLKGEVVEGGLRPSSDTPTHLALYQTFGKIGGVAHTHSRCATAFAQARRPIPAYGTTHADCFYGAVPCTRMLTRTEVAEEYERNTGNIIAEAFRELDENAVPGVLAAGHGPFAWGNAPEAAAYHAAVLEEAAHMALLTELLRPETVQVPQSVLEKHYFRKHGENAYYGQR